MSATKERRRRHYVPKKFFFFRLLFFKKTLLCHAARRRQHLLLFILTKAEMKGKKRSVNGVTNEFSDGGRKVVKMQSAKHTGGGKGGEKSLLKISREMRGTNKDERRLYALICLWVSKRRRRMQQGNRRHQMLLLFSVFLCERRRCIVVPEKSQIYRIWLFLGQPMWLYIKSLFTPSSVS